LGHHPKIKPREKCDEKFIRTINIERMTEPAPVLSGTSEFDKVEQVERTEKPSDEQVRSCYNINELAKHLHNQGLQRIGLQFPDDLIPDSAQVAQLLQSALDKLEADAQVYILADTSYSPCCVDEVAAKHVNSDTVVHFGDACLNPVRSFPVTYVFSSGAYDLDLSKAVELFKSEFPDTSDHILLMSDPQYSAHLHQLYQQLALTYTNLTPTAMKLPEDTDATIIPTHAKPEEYSQSELPSRCHPPLATDLSDYKVFYLTSPSPSASLILHLTTLVSSVSLLQVDHKGQLTISAPKTALQRRYRFMNMARTATTIGILINTLSLRNVNTVIKTVQNWITQAGKKYYTFVVGKPNVPKLANFDVIDMWVVLGCPLGGIIVDCSEFYRPIITPYELNLALQREIMWTGQWLIDFESVLSMNAADDSEDDNESNSENMPSDDDDEPVFDPVTGKFAQNSRPLRQLEHIKVEQEAEKDDPAVKALATRMSSQIAIRGTVSTAAQHLHSKLTWSGLGSDFESQEYYDPDGAVVEKGRGGIARGYAVDSDDRT
jgi:diphthamide biosynthesis protein 2